MLSLPYAFEERMKKLLGTSYESFYNEITSGAPSKAFFLAKDYSLDDEKSLKASPIAYFDKGFYFDFDGIGNTPLHHAGGIYIQDPSAMATIGAVRGYSFTNVLDMCASPGGKSLGAYLGMNDGGVIVCNEFNPSRCKTLVGNIERFGIKNAIVTSFDMTKENELCDTYPEFFDLVICDAPCSGEGMFRKYPDEAISEWSVDNVKVCAERQKKILDNAALFVKENGLLLYSTCTFSLDENEMQADSFLERHPEFEIINVDKSVADATVDGNLFDGYLHESIALTRRFYPHISKGEGQYIALFRKKTSSRDNSRDRYTYPLSKPTDTEMRILSDFIKSTLYDFDFSKVYKYNDNLVFVDFDARIPSKKVFSCGVKLGEVIKNRFEPHHQFFKCFSKDFKLTTDLHSGDERLAKYLHGEVIDADIPNGWCVVCYEGLPLGGGKAVDGVIKNHYPKGLRTV